MASFASRLPAGILVYMWQGTKAIYNLGKADQENPVYEQLVENRGFDTERQSPPRYADLSTPWQLSDMEKTVDRIIQAITDQQKIAIYADYDADGVPAAVILHDFFTKIGYADFQVYIPHRHDEGYGLHTAAIDKLEADGVQLIVTVDVGIRAFEGVQHAQDHGIDVIVTDHHEEAADLPKAFAIVNPKLGDYPDRMLCGAAVAWQLVRALSEKITADKLLPFSEKLTEGWEKWLLDMVGIATISDMVPLVGENRILATYGLVVLRKTKRPGLVALYRANRLDPQSITETDVGFTIAPRINAASRMSHPEYAFSLFTAPDQESALPILKHLESCNTKRKTQTSTIVRAVNKRLHERELGSVVVIGDASWNPGVIGIVASKIVDNYGCAAFVWAENEAGVLRGSCRAPVGISLVQLMEALPEDALIEFGGHDGAGGFGVTKDTVHFLEEHLKIVFADLYPEGVPELPTHNIDAVTTLDQVTRDTYQSLRALAPFGEGNPAPLLLLAGVTITQIREFGKTKEHLEIYFGAKKAIAFFAHTDSFGETLDSGQVVNAVVEIERSLFAGKDEIRMRLVDIVSLVE